MKKENQQYELFKKMLAKEIGYDETDERVPMLMSKLKRAECKLHRLNEGKANTGFVNKQIVEQYKAHVVDLLKKHKTITVSFNGDPRGGAIRLIFTKTGWINTLGSDVCVDW